MKPGTHGYKEMKKRVHETEVHLNYCKYFPVNEDYLPLTFAKNGLNQLNGSKVDGTRSIERRAAQIWKLVEQCARDGTLQDLKDGRLYALLEGVPLPDQTFVASALKGEYPQGATKGHDSILLHGNGPKEALNGDASVASADVKPITEEDGNFEGRHSTSESDIGVILNLDYGNENDKPLKLETRSSTPVTKSGIKNEVMSSDVDEGQDKRTNIEDKDSQSSANSNNKDAGMSSDVEDKYNRPVSKSVINDEEMIDDNDDDLYTGDSGTASNNDTESNESSVDGEGQSEDGDAMMQYSNSEQITTDEGGRNVKKIAVLADLSPHDLNAQLRYFHTTKAREEVDGKTPVRCLVCAKEGHMAEVCEVLTCSTCGAVNRHTTQACPNNAKCGKCREQGHNEGHCPYKLKRMAGHEIVCDLCQRNGHIEEDCELVWRTSGRPWESDLAHANLRLSCYECGGSGHLGNSCHSRKPHKVMGTSTWDGSMGPVTIKSTQEIKIKGKATRQDPHIIDDSDDERANFYRPKITLPQPVRKGQIRIVTGGRDMPEYEPSRSDRPAYADEGYGSFASNNESYRNREARRPYQEYRDGARDKWRVTDGVDNGTGHADHRYNSHRASDRRSRSPLYRDNDSYAGGKSWPSSRLAPQADLRDRRPAADANIYRPMPSAAQNAWIRRRL